MNSRREAIKKVFRSVGKFGLEKAVWGTAAVGAIAKQLDGQKTAVSEKEKASSPEDILNNWEHLLDDD